MIGARRGPGHGARRRGLLAAALTVGALLLLGPAGGSPRSRGLQLARPGPARGSRAGLCHHRLGSAGQARQRRRHRAELQRPGRGGGGHRPPGAQHPPGGAPTVTAQRCVRGQLHGDLGRRPRGERGDRVPGRQRPSRVDRLPDPPADVGRNLVRPGRPVPHLPRRPGGRRPGLLPGLPVPRGDRAPPPRPLVHGRGRTRCAGHGGHRGGPGRPGRREPRGVWPTGPSSPRPQEESSAPSACCSCGSGRLPGVAPPGGRPRPVRPTAFYGMLLSAGSLRGLRSCPGLPRAVALHCRPTWSTWSLPPCGSVASIGLVDGPAQPGARRPPHRGDDRRSQLRSAGLRRPGGWRWAEAPRRPCSSAPPPPADHVGSARRRPERSGRHHHPGRSLLHHGGHLHRPGPGGRNPPGHRRSRLRGQPLRDRIRTDPAGEDRPGRPADRGRRLQPAAAGALALGHRGPGPIRTAWPPAGAGCWPRYGSRPPSPLPSWP